ncbi:MAG: alpha-glucan family phosphorylase [Candidatus Levybacteria bacterium]|nr:alpha-glucan family phosphorylase [Candidatus Levybacteria bacterium]
MFCLSLLRLARKDFKRNVMIGQDLCEKLLKHPIAYFCAEFALSDKLPIYSGGLGILAGDVVREANDQRLPFVAVGLFYKEGYFRQVIENGKQKERYDKIDTTQAGLTLVKKADGTPLLIDIPMPDSTLFIQTWVYSLGGVRVFLLDTDIEQNIPHYRKITQGLYRGNRILQEIALGIGGERILSALSIHPGIYHLNEGHSAFAIFEIVHHYMKERNISFIRAFRVAKRKIFFTNHTLVPAGNDEFTKKELGNYLACYAKHLDLPLDEMLRAGEEPNDSTRFSMTILALNTTSQTNAVSKKHSLAAKSLWPNKSLMPITNGIHLPTWISEPINKATDMCRLEKLAILSDETLWQLHKINKAKMVSFITETTGKAFDVERATLVWARRFASYKQPGLLFSEIETLKKIATSAHGALQIVISGKSDPNDEVGKSIIAELIKKINATGLRDRIVFVPNYSMSIAQILVAGADIWLNTPIPGEEASGTSGMKAGANGALVCSTSDGWVDEVDWTDIGWILESNNTAKSLYTLLETSILPSYYTIADKGYSVDWVKRMKKTMQIVWKQYSATRMLDDYVNKLYKPSLAIIEKDKH